MSTKEYGCFFCDGKSTDPHCLCPTCGRPINIGELLLKCTIEDYTPVGILGRGFYGWTLKVEERYQHFAMKLIPKRRLRRKLLADNEARSLADCSPHRNIARFWREIQTTMSLQGQDVPIVCLRSSPLFPVNVVAVSPLCLLLLRGQFG